MDRRLVVGMLKDWGLALLIVVAVLVVWNWLEPGPPSSGSAPPFELTDVAGEKVSLADLRGDAIVVNFWATWCGPCREEIPELAAFHAAHPEVPMVGISIDDEMALTRLDAVAKHLGITYPVLYDASGSAAEAYGVSGIPVTFILDKKHEIRAVIEGGTSRSRLERAVANL